MKKKITALTILAMLCVGTFGTVVSAAEAYKERLVIVSNKHDGDMNEANYYLTNGGTVTKMETINKGSEVVYCYIVIKYPATLPDFVKK